MIRRHLATQTCAVFALADFITKLQMKIFIEVSFLEINLKVKLRFLIIIFLILTKFKQSLRKLVGKDVIFLIHILLFYQSHEKSVKTVIKSLLVTHDKLYIYFKSGL